MKLSEEIRNFIENWVENDCALDKAVILVNKVTQLEAELEQAEVKLSKCLSDWGMGPAVFQSRIKELEAENERLREAGEEAWIYMFDDMPKKFNAKRRAYERFYEALGGK